ncbi:hypothetical protein BH10PLA1_BH10PLA1_03620 [soil metagenome]
MLSVFPISPSIAVEKMSERVTFGHPAASAAAAQLMAGQWVMKSEMRQSKKSIGGARLRYSS